ncbi:MAG: HlyD family type I secretion periplasmic adaptor subunit [Pseudomonadota bacterium]
MASALEKLREQREQITSGHKQALDRLSKIMEEIARPQNAPAHLTQSIALEESALPNALRISVGIVGALLFTFLLWAGLTHVEEMASASGQVIPSGYVQSIQHLEGGIVRDILVHDGDIVAAGQPLIRLDNTNALADLGQMQSRKDSLSAQADRLRHFTNSAASPDAASMTDDDRAILQSMEEARESQRLVVSDQIAQKEKELKALIAARVSLSKNVELLSKENAIRQGLAKKGYGSELMAMASQREFNQLQAQYDEAMSLETRAHDALNEVRNRLQSLNADLKQQAMKTLGDVEAQLAEVKNTFEKYESAEKRTLIASPVRGIVKGLSVHTIGAVVEQGRVLLEIVPVDEELIVEAMVSPNDIGHLRLGQGVKVKVSTFDSARYGSVSGKLTNVSATTFQSQDNKSFYKALVKLDKPYVGTDPKRNLITPGMTVQADIVTGKKTLLQYLLKPIYTSTESAFHEF